MLRLTCGTSYHGTTSGKSACESSAPDRERRDMSFRYYFSELVITMPTPKPITTIKQVSPASDADLYRALITPDGAGVRVKSAVLSELIDRARRQRSLEIKRSE
jgi:hypothetical protein